MIGREHEPVFAGDCTGDGRTDVLFALNYDWWLGTVNGNQLDWTLVFEPVPPSPPKIMSFAPTRGPVGTSVTITGTHFGNVTRVLIGDEYANPVQIASDEVINATVSEFVPLGFHRIMVRDYWGNEDVSDGAFTVEGAVGAPTTQGGDPPPPPSEPRPGDPTPGGVVPPQGDPD